MSLNTLSNLSKRLFKISIYTVLALSFTNNAFADTIKIGVAGAHSGELASYGIPTLNATQLVVDEFNAKGGLLGKKIEILSADDMCKPELSTNAATSLISQKVVGVIGFPCSGSSAAAIPLFHENNTVLISSASTMPNLTLSEDNKIFFRTIPHYYEQSRIAAKFIGEGARPKKLALLHDNSAYSSGLAENIRERIEKNYKNIKVVLYEAITPGAADYSATARKLRRENADFLVWAGYVPEAAKLLNSMRSLDINIPMIGAESLKDDNFIITAGADSEGTYVAAPAETANNPLSIKARKAHQEKFGNSAGAFFDNGYAAAYALLNAIEKAKTTNTDDIIKILRTQKINTPIGNIKFDKNGDAEGLGLTIYQVRNGKFVPVFNE